MDELAIGRGDRVIAVDVLLSANTSTTAAVALLLNARHSSFPSTLTDFRRVFDGGVGVIAEYVEGLKSGSTSLYGEQHTHLFTDDELDILYPLVMNMWNMYKEADTILYSEISGSYRANIEAGLRTSLKHFLISSLGSVFRNYIPADDIPRSHSGFDDSQSKKKQILIQLSHLSSSQVRVLIQKLVEKINRESEKPRRDYWKDLHDTLASLN